MEEWILPYKLIISDNGLLVIYENNLKPEDGRSDLQVINLADSLFLRIDKKHIIRIDNLIFDCIMKTRKITIAACGQQDVIGIEVGYIDITDVHLGKIIAYLEGIANSAA